MNFSELTNIIFPARSFSAVIVGALVSDHPWGPTPALHWDMVSSFLRTLTQGWQGASHLRWWIKSNRMYIYIYIYEIPGFSYKQTTLLISYILYIPPIPISYWHVWHQWTPISNSPMVPPPFQEKILDGQRVAATLHCTTKEEMVSAPRFWPIWEWMETYDSMIYPLVI